MYTQTHTHPNTIPINTQDTYRGDTQGTHTQTNTDLTHTGDTYTYTQRGHMHTHTHTGDTHPGYIQGRHTHRGWTHTNTGLTHTHRGAHRGHNHTHRYRGTHRGRTHTQDTHRQTGTHSLAQCGYVGLLQWAVVYYSQCVFRLSEEAIWVKFLLGVFQVAFLRDRQ